VHRTYFEGAIMSALRLALQFLTKLPLPSEKVTPLDFAWSYYFYPLIGFGIGVAAVAVRHGLTFLFPESFSIVGVLAFLSWITGGLHEDGLADVADGMGGGWTVKERLTIMKDSRIGAFGAMTLVFAILAKYAALNSMNAMRIDGAIITAQVLARWAFLPLGYFNLSAQHGLGSDFMKGLNANTVIVGTLFSGVLVILVFKFQGGLALGLSCAVVTAASLYFRRMIGGITGDCFGATYQFVEIATYAVFLA
jgi:adenosylcobinamide-GDP ribazoletransferase